MDNESTHSYLLTYVFLGKAFESFDLVKDIQTALYYKARVLDILGRQAERSQVAALFAAKAETAQATSTRKNSN